MSELIICDRYRVPCPEGFRRMTEKERRNRFNAQGDGDTVCLINEEGHMVVSIGWKKVNAFAGLLLRLIRPAASMEASIARSMDPYGYRKETTLTRRIGSRAAEGFRYTYVAGGTAMVGESYVLQEGRSLTFFHVYLRDVLRAESLAKWNAMLDAVEPV